MLDPYGATLTSPLLLSIELLLAAALLVAVLERLLPRYAVAVAALVLAAELAFALRLLGEVGLGRTVGQPGWRLVTPAREAVMSLGADSLSALAATLVAILALASLALRAPEGPRAAGSRGPGLSAVLLGVAAANAVALSATPLTLGATSIGAAVALFLLLQSPPRDGDPGSALRLGG